tara:strand:+ start:72 stop:1298 length:1227 start_codon:yes stop_codon:yes gene_type:complete
MNNSSKEISSIKKITAYKKIIKFKDIGLSDNEIAKKLKLSSTSDIGKILDWGKVYFRESELLEFNKMSPKASLLITQEKNIELFEKSLPEYERKLINLGKLNELNLPKEILIYLGKLSKALESGNYIKLRLRHLVYFHNKWIELLINNSKKEISNRIPVDNEQNSWLYLIAGLDTCSRIFIDKKLSSIFIELKNHILKTKPWYIIDKQDSYEFGIFNNLLKFINPDRKKIKNTELEYGNKRIESYILKGTTYSNKIRVYLDNITRELNQYSILDFKNVLKNVIPIPDSLSKKQFVANKYIEIDTLRFFSVELLNLSSYNCYRLISLDIIKMKDDEFIKKFFPSNKVLNSSNYNDYVNYYLWCKKNTIKEYEKLVEYEKRGNIKSSEKIIQVNALGDMIDDISGNLDII